MSRIRVEGKVAYVQIAGGLEAKIDLGDLSLVSAHSWHRSSQRSHSAGYATTRIDGKTVYMHRLILSAPPRLQVDHINHDTFDNRRTNLRLVTNAENNQNRSGAYRSKNSTGVRGVVLDYRGAATYLRPRVMLDGKTYYGPYFEHSKQGLKDAAQWVYDKRRELMPFSSHDVPFVSDEALARMPDVARERVFAAGRHHGMARHSEADIREIRRLAREGVRQVRIAEQYGISGGAVSQIVNRVIWAHLED